jgi:hypothetical protein
LSAARFDNTGSVAFVSTEGSADSEFAIGSAVIGIAADSFFFWQPDVTIIAAPIKVSLAKTFIAVLPMKI